MALVEEVSAAYEAVLKEKDTRAVATLRTLRASLHNREIELRRPLTDEEAAEVVRKEVKLREEAAASYVRGGALERAAWEREEAEILKKFLPATLSEDELRSLVEKAIAEVGAESLADFGRVMGVLMPRVGGRAEGAAVAALVRKLLS